MLESDAKMMISFCFSHLLIRFQYQLRIVFVVLFFFSFSLPLSTQASDPLKKCTAHDEAFFSKILPSDSTSGRKISVRIFLPKLFNNSQTYSVVYFLHGRSSDRKMLELLDLCPVYDLQIDRGMKGFIIVAPEGGNHYWMNEALTGERWGDLITQELVDWMETSYRVFRQPHGRLIAGISMGGHGAFQLSLNHPEIFGAVAGHSPVFRTEQEANEDFHEQFGTGEQYLNRDPFSLIQVKGKRLGVPLWIDMGGADSWLQNTQKFGNLLLSLNEKITLRIGSDSEGRHELSYWRKNLPTYLEWYSEHLQAPF